MRTKESIRADYKKERGALPLSRREKAKEVATHYLKAWLEDHLRSHPGETRKVLSFAPLDEEINIWLFNELLAKKHLLALPRVYKGTLVPCEVNDIEEDLVEGNFGILEPKNTCKATSFEEIFAIFVPALAFDDEMHRLGFGKGYYDRFLEAAHDIPKIGIGFREQLHPVPLPSEEHDVKLTHRFLF